jgi:thioredoxin reductase (NADPH)
MRLSARAHKVTIVIRAGSLQTLSQYLVDRIQAASNIEVLPYTEVTALHGDKILCAITLSNNRTGAQEIRNTRRLFVE